MRTVTAREANQGFSKLLAAVEAGEEVLITKRGRPVAKLARAAAAVEAPDRRRRVAEIIEALRARRLHLGGKGFARDEMHER